MLPCCNPTLIELTNQKKPRGHNPCTCMWTNRGVPRHHLLHLLHETLTLIFSFPSITMAAATLAGSKFSNHREPPTPSSVRTCTTMEAQFCHLLHCGSSSRRPSIVSHIAGHRKFFFLAHQPWQLHAPELASCLHLDQHRACTCETRPMPEATIITHTLQHLQTMRRSPPTSLWESRRNITFSPETTVSRTSMPAPFTNATTVALATTSPPLKISQQHHFLANTIFIHECTCTMPPRARIAAEMRATSSIFISSHWRRSPPGAWQPSFTTMNMEAKTLIWEREGAATCQSAIAQSNWSKLVKQATLVKYSNMVKD